MRSIGARAFCLAATLASISVSAQPDARQRKYDYEDILQPFFVLDPARPGWYRSDRAGAFASSFAAVKSQGAFRVFVIGGSAGLLKTGSGPGDLARALQAALPSRTIEVINCGMDRYDSFREALVEQEILEYAPDLIVFLTGHNEGLAPAPIPTWVSPEPERRRRFAEYLAYVKTLAPDDGSGIRRGDEHADARDAAFARNLADNVRHARERGAAVALVVPPRDYRAPAELGLTPYDARFSPGWLRFLRGDYAGARRFWLEALAERPGATAPDGADKAFVLGFLARSEEKLGLEAEARASFEQAASLDRGGCGASCHDVIRGVAAREGGIVVEADRMFRALAHPRMPGLEMFNDRVRWKPRFSCLMAAEIASSLRGDPRLGALPWDDARARAFKDSCGKPGGAGGTDDDRRLLNSVLVTLSSPGFHSLSMAAAFDLQALRGRRPLWFDDPAALLADPRSRGAGGARAPDAVVLPRFYWHIGEARMLEKDYTGAIVDFSKALELDPGLAWTRVSLAVAEVLRGDKKRGAALLKDATALASGDSRRKDIIAAAAAADKTLELGGGEALAGADPGYWIKKAETAIDAGDKTGSLAALERARTMSPPPHQLRLIGQYYRMLGESGKLLEISGALTAAYPKDAGVWILAAEASFLDGRTEAGLAALERAEQAEPGAVELRQIADLRGRLAAGGPPGRARP